MRLTFCGVRGSRPSPGAAFVRYGGHTSCLAVQADDAPVRLLLDGGCGLIAATDLLDGPFDGTVLLGHLHWDHTHGLPFFGGGTCQGARVRVLLPEQGVPARELLERCFSPPHFPVTPSELGPGWSVAGIDEGRHTIEGFDVLAREIPHPGGRALGYRIERGLASVAYLTDHSPTSAGAGPDGLGARHEAALALAAGADVLVHDAQHVAAEFPEQEYLGHACVEYAVALGREAGVGRVVLTHHAPTRTDDELDAIAGSVSGCGLPVVVAAQGLVIELPER